MERMSSSTETRTVGVAAFAIGYGFGASSSHRERSCRCGRRLRHGASAGASRRAPPNTPRVSMLAARGPVETIELIRGSVRQVRCPFLRRRAGDALDAASAVAQWLSARHKRLDFGRVPPPPPPTAAAAARGGAAGGDFVRRACDDRQQALAHKTTGLSAQSVAAVLRHDFCRRHYYISGALSLRVYRDDCVFDGPDPDLPITGARKYIDAAAQLFDRRLSRCDLLSLTVVNERCIRAMWRLEGTLRLPWKPSVKPFLGATTFTLDEDSLVCRHDEDWSISAFDAFVSTLLWSRFGAAPAPPTESILALLSRRAP